MPNALGDMPVPHDVAVRFSNYGIPVTRYSLAPSVVLRRGDERLHVPDMLGDMPGLHVVVVQ
jgi:hypothetical protein